MSHPTYKRVILEKQNKCYLKEMIKMEMKPKTLLYHKAFFNTLLLFKLKLGILARVHLTVKLKLSLLHRPFIFSKTLKQASKNKTMGD